MNSYGDLYDGYESTDNFDGLATEDYNAFEDSDFEEGFSDSFEVGFEAREGTGLEYEDDFELDAFETGFVGETDDWAQLESQDDFEGLGLEGLAFEGLAAESLSPLGDYQVIGVDTRVRILATQRIPFRYICKLESTYVHPRSKQVRKGGCTGTLVAANKVLTAAHCLYKPGYGYARSVKVTPAKSASKAPFGSSTARSLVVPSQYRSASSNAQRRPYDYGVITLKSNLGSKVGWWKQLASPSDKILQNALVNTAGYPGDKGGQHLYWTNNRIVKVHPRRLEYLHDTFGGQSGSPIWLKRGKQRWLIGIHTTRDLDGAPVANTGVRLSKPILDDIKRWLKA